MSHNYHILSLNKRQKTALQKFFLQSSGILQRSSWIRS